jgi:5-(carboxyamino)imidazole ribonucleotide synthase
LAKFKAMKELRNLNIGILGGGQLGRMLSQAGVPLNVKLAHLDPDANCPASPYSKQHVIGSFKNSREVREFGKDKDIVSVEIEEVAVEALEEIEALGVKVYPQPNVLQTIRDKGIQKQFYYDNNLPTMPFKLFQSASELLKSIEAKETTLPFVQKSRRFGYDGQGVRVIKTTEDLNDLLDTPCITEELCNMDLEISVLVARSSKGEVKTWDPVEMVFDPTLCYPARISEEISKKATELAVKTAEAFGIIGILAVEMFLTAEGELIINECAPRPHNSGHQTIESSVTSQYEQHIRAITGLPLGNTDIKVPSTMVNLIGEEGFSGEAKFIGLDKALEIPGVKVHDYGKAETRPFRKMGHVTITDQNIEEALKKAAKVKQVLKVES